MNCLWRDYQGLHDGSQQGTRFVLENWPHGGIDFVSTGPSGTSVIAKLLVAAAHLLDPSKHRHLTGRILAVHIVEGLRDFLTRTPFQRQKFDYGAPFC
jgi:hypothetical protein